MTSEAMQDDNEDPHTKTLAHRVFTGAELAALIARDADVQTLDDYQAVDGRPYVTVPAPFQFEDKTWGHKFAPGRYATPAEARAKAAAWVREQKVGR